MQTQQTITNGATSVQATVKGTTTAIEVDNLQLAGGAFFSGFAEERGLKLGVLGASLAAESIAVAAEAKEPAMTYQTTAPADHRGVKASSPSRGWLTAVLRPAGTLEGASAAAFGRSLGDLSATADMIVVDLDVARIPDLAAFVDALRPAAARLSRPGKCLLLANTPSGLAHAVHMAGVPAATLPADTVPSNTG